MEFKKEDFSAKFRNQFNDEEFQILINFCESYYKKFGQYTTKQEIINKISKLGAFTYFSDPNSSVLASHITTSTTDYKKILQTYITINAPKYKNLTIEEKKATIYHELIHHFSTLEKEGSLIQSGLNLGKQTEPTYFDEIMTEFYATELLRMENIDIKRCFLTKRQTKLDLSSEIIQADGTGYSTISKLGKTFDAILGKKIFDGKTKDFETFESIFNERFQSISQIPAINFINNQLYTAFHMPGNILDPNNRLAIYDCYKTALEVFHIDRQFSYEKKGFDLYNYLKSSRRVMSTLPTKTLSSFSMDKTRGIPEELFDTLSAIDREMIIKYICPDILQIQDENERNQEINKLSSVINILRENIGSLSKEDIEQITYGKIKEYSHNGLDCLIINAGNKTFQTFVNNSDELNAQFMPYCSFKTPESYDKLLDTNTDQQTRQTFTEAGYQLGENYTLSTVMNVGGQYTMYGLVENNGIFYKTSGELQEVQIIDEKPIVLKTKQPIEVTTQPKENTTQISNNSAINKKMAWIKKFIDSYDITESDIQYDYRQMYEDNCTLQVLRAIEKGEFIGEGLSKIDITSKSDEFDIERSIAKIVRLLKSADNITIEGGRNYLEEFTNIPNITQILLIIKNSESCRALFTKAEETKRKGTITQHKKTKAEIDKEYAQQYLRSGNISQTTLAEELAYRAEAIKGCTERIIGFNAKSEKEIPIDKRKKTAVERIIARQQGKIPGEIIERNGMLVFDIDTQNEQLSKRNTLTPINIVASTLKENTTLTEITGVTAEIRRTQIKDLQQTEQK